MVRRTGRSGQPSKDTPAVRAIILMALSKAVSRKGAAAAAGISYSTLAAWVAHDPEFSEACTRAEAAAEVIYVGIIRDAAPQDWRAAAWMLERRLNDLYGRKDRVDMTVDVAGAVKRVAAETGLDEDALLAEAERILSESRR